MIPLSVMVFVCVYSTGSLEEQSFRKKKGYKFQNNSHSHLKKDEHEEVGLCCRLNVSGETLSFVREIIYPSDPETFTTRRIAHHSVVLNVIPQLNDLPLL